MTETIIPRGIFLPPEGRPRWQPRGPDKGDLTYLSWGARWMGDHPIPLALHEGWVYVVITSGSPVLVVKNGEFATDRGDVFIFHPDCAYGWRDKVGGTCRPLNWQWRTPPAHSLLVPEPGGFQRFQVSDATLRQLAGINRQCHREILVSGETTLLALRRAHLDLDICLARALRRTEKVTPHHRAKLAVKFLQENLAVLQPAKSLCEHLQVSPATLRALFQKHIGRGPQAVALELRMKWAKERLAEGGISVKEIAYELGYRHPNDFSRAYKRFFGSSALKKVA